MPIKHFHKYHTVIMTLVLVAGSVVLILTMIGGSESISSSRVISSDFADNKTTLELLHVVFRHGPRTPADTYPKDPHVNQTFYPYGWGHITNSGRRELFGIGRWLRKRYGRFLDTYYQPDLVHAQATGVTRTHMSLQMVLASLFPPKNTPMEWNPNYNWQPIPIFSEPLEKDTFLLVRTTCPRYHEAVQEILESPKIVAEIEPYTKMIEELRELTGSELKDPEDIQSLYLTLLAEEEFGLELPDWTAKYYPEQMKFLAEQSYIYNVYTPEMQKIKAGPFLKKMFDEMTDKRDGKLKPDKRKLLIYTGHDTTIVNIMNALNIWERQLPRYSAMAMFELHNNKETGEYYVEIYFRNNPKVLAQPLTVPGCAFQCPLDKLIELSKDVIPTEADTNVCNSKDEHFTEPPLRGP